jgi:glycosyltransferase involved in cell wall biosynthesis
MEEQLAGEPIDIILVTYQRENFLKKTVEEINKRTLYPFRLIVVDNASTDGTRAYMKHAEKVGKIQKNIFLEENIGQPEALNVAYKEVKSEFFVTTQDDLIPPDLRPCWLERLKHLMEKYPDYGCICMRIQRTKRVDWEEKDDLIINFKTIPSVYRMCRKSDIDKLGEDPFGHRKHWESHSFADAMRRLKKKFAMATHLYCDHFGFAPKNKGYEDEFTDYFTYSPERVNQGDDKPYPTIDPKTNIPLEIHHQTDRDEHQKRLDYWGLDTGVPDQGTTDRKWKQRFELGKYVDKLGGDKWIEIGCGSEKCNEKCLGIDTSPFSVADIHHDGSDLWFFKDGELDGVIACHALEHFPDTKQVLREWARVIKPGGIIAFIVPDGDLRPKTIREASHKVSLNRATVHQLMKNVLEFKVLRIGPLEEIAKPVLICVAQKRII